MECAGSNYTATSLDYYGRLSEIIQIQYSAIPIKRMVLFKCEWFDPTPNHGIRVHKDYKLVEINHKKKFNKYEPFVLAAQATQVYYVPFSSRRRDKVDWWAVCKVKPRSIIDAPMQDLALQEDEIEQHGIDIDLDASGPLNDVNGVFIDVDDEDNDVDAEDEGEYD